MATIRAIASGNWSATGTWNGGVLPGNGDTVYSNGFTVTIDQNLNIGGANNPTVNAGSFVSGQWYQINNVGSTSFTGIGAATNTVGTIFLSSGAGSGTGTAIALATLTTASNTAAGATAGAGGFSLLAAYNVNADIRAGDNKSTCLTISASSGTVNMTGQVIATPTASNGMHGIVNSSTATVILNGYSVFGIPQNGWTSYAILNSAAGIIRLNSCIIGNLSRGITILNNGAGEIVVNGGTVSAVDSAAVIQNAASGSITVNNATLTGGSSGTNGFAINNAASGLVNITGSTITSSAFASAVNNAAAGSLICASCTFTSANGINAVNSTNASATNRFSGTFISSSNGTQPINASRWILNSSPTVSYIQHALDGINANSFVRFFTADNSSALNQAAPTDVRSGVAYGIGNSQTGRLTVPARGSVALSVNYGPSMPFTATRSDTIATATLAYSYPLVVGDLITVTGSSNTEWNSSYTIASVVSGTSVTFTVPATHSATAGTGATMQTTGTAVLDPAAVASAVWGAASRTITGGLVDTATTLTNAPASVTPSDIWSHASRTITGGTVDTLTNAPSVPSAASIRAEIDSNSTQLAAIKSKTDALPASPAATGDIPSANITAIKAKTDLLVTDRLAQCSTVATTGAQLAAALS